MSDGSGADVMKKLLGGVALGLCLAAPAMAADMPVKARPVPVVDVAYSWTGFYIGGHIGYGWSDLDWNDNGGFNLSHRGKGVLGGGQGGFNWQWNNNLVLGVEVDGTFTDIDGSRACPNPIFRCSHNVDSLVSVRGRLGALVGATRQFLLYGTGGAAWGRVEYEARNATTGALNPGGFESSATHTGWVGGGGIEYKFASNWSAKAEYLYYGLRSKTQDCSPQPTVGTIICTWKPEVQTVKLGINWHFNVPGAIVARN